MKLFYFIVISLISSSSFANYINTNWQYNSGFCAAETYCYNGRRISCQVVSFNYGNAPRTINNLCRTRVVPGRFVHCQGYADRINSFGQTFFVPVNLPVSCY